ncbi:adenylate kinase 2 [Plasmodium gonderi]|uniref:Adenylate kinase 2 n=1 Tax=Plasmodium gonderi TaxID=77519 RepID=A0A1Y1JDH5_PLAGO|nr:adenylate kinase 2 [Plasmodium gonderi]GAW79738.1 adenylate kinase 2 [Plasmodium gonderi]
MHSYSEKTVEKGRISNDKRKKKIYILNGAAGSGKDTQCKLVSEKYYFPIITISTLLKEYIKENEQIEENTNMCDKYAYDLGEKENEKKKRKKEDLENIKKCMNDGSLVSDDVVMRIFLNRLEKYLNNKETCSGILINGFPRTYEQALLFAKNDIEITNFINIQVKKDTLLKRINNRMADPITNINYSAEGIELFLKKKKGAILTSEEESLLISQGKEFQNLNDEIIDRLVRRADDKEATFNKRFDVYEKNKHKIESLFLNACRDVDGNGSIDQTFAQICAIIGPAPQDPPT